MLHDLLLNSLYAILCVYFFGVVLAFQLEELMYHFRRDNPCAYNHAEHRLGGEGLKGMMLRSGFSLIDVYALCQLQAVAIRKDEA